MKWSDTKKLYAPILQQVGSHGHAMLEMMFFSPLALAFLFIAIDASFSLVEHTAISQAISSSIKGLPLLNESSAAILIDQNGETEIDLDLLNDIVASFGNSLEEKILQAARRASTDNAQYLIEIFAVTFDIDERLGTVQNFYLVEPGFTRSRGIDSITQAELSDFQTLKSPLEFINAELENAKGSDSSLLFAIPLTPYYLASSEHMAGHKYMPHSVGIYLSVVAQPYGLNASFVRNTLGKYYTVNKQQLVFLRTQTTARIER